jgi:hypothetical protein
MNFLLEPEIIQRNQKNGQDVAKIAASTRGGLAKLKRRIQSDTIRYFGRDLAPQFMIRVKRGAPRKWFPLGADLDGAARRARDILDHLRLHGWKETTAKFRPAAEKAISDLTVGSYIALVELHGNLDPATLDSYSRKLRRITGAVVGLKHTGAEKYSGTRTLSQWRTAVDGVRLDRITDEKIENWRTEFLRRAAIGTTARIKTEHTVNAMVRNARSLFSRRMRQRLTRALPSLRLPEPIPFATVSLLPEHETDYFYFSEVNAQKLITAAFAELDDEQLVVFVLALGAGLRRKEIDNLLWTRVDLDAGTVVVAPTETSRLKTASSIGCLKLEPAFVDVLRRHAAHSKGEYVLCPQFQPQTKRRTPSYRCKKLFKTVNDWLEGQGIKRTNRRIHTLRKEFGSHLAAKHGIFVASAGLRHSTLAVTRKFYAASKAVPTAFFAPEIPPENNSTDVAEAVVKMLLDRGVFPKAS